MLVMFIFIIKGWNYGVNSLKVDKFGFGIFFVVIVKVY